MDACLPRSKAIASSRNSSLSSTNMSTRTTPRGKRRRKKSPLALSPDSILLLPRDQENRRLRCRQGHSVSGLRGHGHIRVGEIALELCARQSGREHCQDEPIEVRVARKSVDCHCLARGKYVGRLKGDYVGRNREARNQCRIAAGSLVTSSRS